MNNLTSIKGTIKTLLFADAPDALLEANMQIYLRRLAGGSLRAAWRLIRSSFSSLSSSSGRTDCGLISEQSAPSLSGDQK